VSYTPLIHPGLTLVYCIWISPGDIFNTITSNGINDCSIILFVMAERNETAKKYRNAFEVIRQKVIDQIADGSNPNPREAVGGLAAQLQTAVHTFGVDQPFEVDKDGYDQFSYILADMTGGNFLKEPMGMTNDINSGAELGASLDYEDDSFNFPDDHRYPPPQIGFYGSNSVEDDIILSQFSGSFDATGSFSFNENSWHPGAS
jgi:hypothetical protein